MKQDKIKHFSSFRFYFINIFLCVVIIVMAFIMGSLYFCPLGDVKVSGTNIYSEKEVTDKLLSGKYDDNTVFAFLLSRFTPHKKMEFVQSYSIRMTGLNTLKIKIKQKDIHGYVLGEKGKYVYYDSEGMVIENTKRMVPDIFFVDGLEAKGAKKGEKLSVGSSNVKTILTIQEEFEELGIDAGTVKFSKDGTITFYVGAILVNLGTRSNLKSKMQRLPYILPQIEGKVGTLHLEEWTEENTDIVFEEQQQ